MTDITVLNRSGLPLAWMKELDLNVDVTPGSYDYYCLDRTRTYGYAYGSGLNQAAESYPAGGLISEVYYENPIMGPTVTHVGVKRPEASIGSGQGMRSSIIVYRDLNDRMRTEVTTYNPYATRTRYENSDTGVADAGSYYSYTGTRPEWLEDRIIAAYAEDRNSSTVNLLGSSSGSQSIRDTAASAGAADSQSAAVAGTADNKNKAGTSADGSKAKGKDKDKKDKGSNGKDKKTGNQASSLRSESSMNCAKSFFAELRDLLKIRGSQ